MADDADRAHDHIERELHARLTHRVRYTGQSALGCERCGDLIPEARRLAVPGTRYCTYCQTVMERP